MRFDSPMCVSMKGAGMCTFSVFFFLFSEGVPEKTNVRQLLCAVKAVCVQPKEGNGSVL